MDDIEDDHVDMAELEANLYAQIHHDAPDTVVQFSPAEKLQQRDVTLPIPQRLVTNNTVVNNNHLSLAAADATGQKRGRYWASAGQSSAPFSKTPYSKPWNSNLVPKDSRFSDTAKPSPNAVPTSLPDQPASTDYRPKPFTPYTSYLSQYGTTPVPLSATASTAPKPAAAISAIVRTQDELIAALAKKTRLNKKQKQKQKKRDSLADRRPNPFNRIAENKLISINKLKCKQEKAHSAAARLPHTIDTINLDSDNEEGDDDVICIPIPPPPLVCIDSSDEDEALVEQHQDDDVDPDGKAPENAVVTEDFIGQRDRRRISQCEDALGGLGEEELAFICDTVEQAQIEPVVAEEVLIDGNLETDQLSPTFATRSSSPLECDNRTANVSPKRPNNTNLSYEVTENGFAAVDIYESESSDFPESVYERGKPKGKLLAGETLIDSDSDVSDIEVNIANRLKRRSKRKSSGSNKGSDYRTCSEDDDEMDGSDDDLRRVLDDKPQSTSTPVVQRGDAVALSKSKLVRVPLTTPKRKRRNKSVNEHPSDEEFVSMLSCIVHEDLHSTNDSSAEMLSQNVIGARTIVEHTLKKSARLNSTESAAVKSKTPAKWVVTDEPIGRAANSAGDERNMVENVESLTMEESVPAQKSQNLEGCDNTHLDAEMVADERTVDVGNDSNDNYECVPSCSLVVDNPELCWNDEMRSFYNKSWGGERHSQIATVKGLSNNRQDWTIGEGDLFPSTPQTSKRFNARHLRCNNCREKGHRAQDCYQPPKAIRCHMCGEGGHREPRCPNTICLRCGFKTNVFSRGCQRCLAMASMQCHQCKARGHGIKDCPDKWRRYHSTTKPNIPPESVPAISKTKYCCVCASAGHLAEYCRHALRIMDNPAQPIKIQSYTETYQRLEPGEVHPDGSQLDGVAPFSLVSVPLTHFNFAWDVNERPNRFYGRIMKATKMQRTPFIELSKKRRVSEQEICDNNKHTRKMSKAIKDSKDMVINPLSVVQQKTSQICLSNVEVRSVDSAADGDIEMNGNKCGADDTTVDAVEKDGSIELVSQVPKLLNASEQESTALKHEVGEVAEENQINDSPTDPTDELIPITNDCGPPTLSEVQETPAIASSLPEASVVMADSLNQTQDYVGLINFSFTTALEEIEKNKLSSAKTFELNFIQNTDTLPDDTQETQDVENQDRPKTPPPPNISFSALTEDETHEICAEMQRLEQQEQMLNHLKKKIITTQKANRVIPEHVSEGVEDAVGYHVELTEDFEEAAAAAAADIAHDSDSNYSFSDYFAKHHAATTGQEKPAGEIVTFEDAVKMPDFIPLGRDEDFDLLDAHETHEPSQSTTSKESIPFDQINNDDNPSKYGEAKIFLTKDHSKYLLRRNGGLTFLSETYTKHNVIVRMEWRNIGNVLIVQGKPSAQDNFHADLMAYCMAAEEDVRKKQEISQQVPKNRATLIRFLKEQISQLEKPLAFAKDCFVRMKINEQQRSKTGTKNADKARKTLNMILFGQTGLRDGAMHLTALQSNLRCLIENETKDVISNVFRNEVFQHYKYIFSSFSHDNYAELVNEYEKMRKSKQLPVLKLDRKLLGLKINVSVAVVPTPTTIEVNSEASNTLQHVISTSVTNRRDSSEHKDLSTIAHHSQTATTDPTDNASHSALPNAQSNVVNELVNMSVIGAVSTVHKNSPYTRHPDTLPSKIWSIKCSEYIQKCRAIPKISNNEKAMERLQQVDLKAKNGALSYTDFRMLMRIFDKCA